MTLVLQMSVILYIQIVMYMNVENDETAPP